MTFCSNLTAKQNNKNGDWNDHDGKVMYAQDERKVQSYFASSQQHSSSAFVSSHTTEKDNDSTLASFDSSTSFSALLQKTTTTLRKVTPEEINKGHLLGSGASCNIFEVQKSSSILPILSTPLTSSNNDKNDKRDNKAPEEAGNDGPRDHHSARFLWKTKNKIRPPASKTDRRKFVIKTLRPELLETPSLFTRNIADLKAEGQILSRLNHRPDIVTIYAWTFSEEEEEKKEDTEATADGKNTKATKSESLAPTVQPDTHFLVLERLDETLRCKLSVWRAHAGYYRSVSKPIISKRCRILLELAEALRFMHSRRIIHRDLKPANIGFREGRLKVFDFGVSRILPPTPTTTKLQEGTTIVENEESKNNKNDDFNNDTMFHMTGRIGTIRYMSPECGLCKPYNLKSDIYSFAVICYEVLTLERPYFDLLAPGLDTEKDRKAIKELVWKKGSRPSLNDCWFQWPRELSEILQDCWDVNVTKRPTMDQALKTLSATLPLLWRRRRRPKKKNKKQLLKAPLLVIFGGRERQDKEKGA